MEGGFCQPTRRTGIRGRKNNVYFLKKKNYTLKRRRLDLASGVASVIHFSSCIATPCAATRVSAASSPASFYSSSSSLTSPAASPSSLILIVVVDDEETVMESAFGNASAITDQRQKTEGNAVQKHILSAVISSSDIVQARRFIDHMSLDDVPLIQPRVVSFEEQETCFCNPLFASNHF
ncbi:hypothetical protein AHAS_Ahas03G0090200 [Arachis hypogaea]